MARSCRTSSGSCRWLAPSRIWTGSPRRAGASLAERRLTLLTLAWFAADYLMISVTADFEPRYATLLTVPPVALSILLLTARVRVQWAGSAAFALGVGLFAVLLATQPAIRVEGYGDVAQYVLEHTTPGDTVLFHGMGSKNFTFSVRARSPVPQIFIMRAEKSLVDYSIMRELGHSRPQRVGSRNSGADRPKQCQHISCSNRTSGPISRRSRRCNG